ncbi:MAG TPA: ABC transporter ATP-binding protein, partial [Segetibacter sp.]
MKKYSRLLKYLRFYKGKIVLYFIFTVLSIIFSLVSLAMLSPFLRLIFLQEKLVLNKPAVIHNSGDLQNFINYHVSHIIVSNGPVTALGFICIIIIVTVLLKNLFLYLSYYVLAPIKNSIMTKLREDLYDKLLQLPIGFFTEQRKGDVMSRMTNDIGELELSVVGALEGFIKDPLNVLIILGTLVFISPALSLFLLIFLPATGVIIGRVSRSLKKQSNTAAVLLGEALSVLDETLGGLRVIKAFNAEKILQNKFNKTNDDLFHLRNKMQFRRDLASPLSELLGVMVLCGILWFGGKLVLGQSHSAGGLDAGNFILYIVVFTQIINPAKALSSSFYNMQKGSAAIARIEELLNAPVKVDENVNGLQLTTFNKEIEFRNVGFSYDDKVILKNINLRVQKGKTIALVGSSGAGKSTLADLIPRFHDVTSGELLIDGINIKDYSLFSVRKQMGIVTQDPILFNDTIAGNIGLGVENPSEEQIMSAAKIAN